MPTEINGFRTRTLDTTDSKSASRTPGQVSDRPAGSPATPASAPVDSVHLTDTATRLQQLQGLMKNAPEVDQARVDAVRKQISEGRYSVNDVHVADKLIALERNLFDISPKR